MAREPFNAEHQEDGGDNDEVVTGDGRKKMSGGTHSQHTRYIAERKLDRRRAEEYPTEGGEEKSEQHLEELGEGRQRTGGGDGVEMAAIAAEEDEWQKEEGVVEAPEEEGPVGAMPQPTDQEDDKGVGDGAPTAGTAAAEGNVEVVAEPGGERDMPAAPELGDIAAEVGDIEVAPQADTEEFGTSDGDVAVAGEVGIDLDGEEERGDDERGGRAV